MSRTYEIGYIVNPESTEEELKKVQDSVTTLIEEGKGKVEKIDFVGRKKFAYVIDKKNAGFYTYINADVDGSVISAIERKLRLNEKVMRYITVRLDDKLKKCNKLDKKWARQEKMQRKFRDIERATEERMRRREAAHSEEANNE